MLGNELVVAKRAAREEAEKLTEADSGRLSAIEEKILLFLIPISSRRHDYGWGTGVSSIAEHVNAGRNLVEGMLNKMRAAQLIDQIPVPEYVRGGTPGWARTDVGDKYLAKYGLL